MNQRELENRPSEQEDSFGVVGCDWLADLLSAQTPARRAASQLAAMSAVDYEGRDASGRLTGPR